MLRKDLGDITHTALHWTPERKQERGRPKNTWCPTVEGEMKTLNYI